MNSAKNTFPVLSSVFVVSTSLIMYEIILTRLYSAVMWYHFVSLAVSIALFSLALGGILVYRYPLKEKKKRQNLKLKTWERSSLTGLAVSILILTLVFYRVPYHNDLYMIYILAGGIPFVFGGIYLSISFFNFPSQSSYIYFADLIGSAAGGALIMKLLNDYSIMRTVVIISLVLLVVMAIRFLPGKKRLLGSVLTSFMFIIAVFFGGIIDEWSVNFKAYQGEPKMLGMLSGNPQSIFTTWDSLAKTDVIETDKDNNKIVLVDGAASSYMLPFNGNYQEVSNLRKETGYLPFAVGERDNALIIGPGGGKDILLAHLAGVHDITAVEINPGTVRAARKFKDFNGNIYDRPGTKTHVIDGRTFISQDKNKYDIIYLSLVMTKASEMQENYIYTAEAFEEYLNHLTEEGKLAFLLHGESDFSKALATAIKVLDKRGISRAEIANHIAIVNTQKDNDKELEAAGQHGEKLYYPLLIVKNTPFKQTEANALLALSQQGSSNPVYLPQKGTELKLPSNDDLESWVVNDNKPFFYNSSNGAPKSVWAILIVMTLGGLIFIYPPLRHRSKEVKHYGSYFALLGISFMLIEIPLLQNFILFLGRPTLTFSTVIASLLFAGGLGSFATSFFKRDNTPVLAGIGIALMVLIMNLKLDDFLAGYQGVPILNKIMIVFLVLLPLGFLMGIPFPVGIKRMEEKNRNFVPVMWGINGWMSVVGSVGALVLAMHFGFTQTLYMGAIGYLLFAVFTLKVMTKLP